jgi:uncharacterized membrane protein
MEGSPMNGLAMGWEAWLFMGAWVLVLAVLLWFLVREPRHPSAREQALDTLRARFARGELTCEEFRDACAILDVADTSRTSDPQGRTTSAGAAHGPTGREVIR